MQQVIFRLAQHPHPHLRGFALELMEKHLKNGFIALAALEEFFRAVLFDTWPERKVKHRVIAFLASREAAPITGVCLPVEWGVLAGY